MSTKETIEGYGDADTTLARLLEESLISDQSDLERLTKLRSIKPGERVYYARSNFSPGSRRMKTAHDGVARAFAYELYCRGRAVLFHRRLSSGVHYLVAVGTTPPLKERFEVAAERANFVLSSLAAE